MKQAGFWAGGAAAVLIAGCAVAPQEVPAPHDGVAPAAGRASKSAPAPLPNARPREDGGIVGTGNRIDCEEAAKKGDACR